MNSKELTIYKKAHTQTMLTMIDIIDEYIEVIPKGMLTKMENYTNEIVYAIDECINGQSKEGGDLCLK